VLPERRRQRAYISSILAKNEMLRDDRYNRKLFYRLKQGHYVFNPHLALKVEGEWVNVYDLLHIDKLTYIPTKKEHADKLEYFEGYLRTFRMQLAQRLQRLRERTASGAQD
jgi:hypothetical protein